MKITLKDYQKEHLKNGGMTILIPIENKDSAPDEIKSEEYSFRPIKVSKLNNISIYEMELLGLESAKHAKTIKEMKSCFVDFEDWYNQNEGEFKNNKHVLLCEVV